MAAYYARRQLHANDHIQMKVVGNYEQGWKGFAFKVMVVSELQTRLHSTQLLKQCCDSSGVLCIPAATDRHGKTPVLLTAHQLQCCTHILSLTPTYIYAHFAGQGLTRLLCCRGTFTPHPQVGRQAPEDTAHLLESLLMIPEVKVGEANQIVTKSRPPRTRRTVRAPHRMDDPQAPPADTTEPEKAEPAPAKPAPPVRAPLPECLPLKGMDTAEHEHVTSPNWGLRRIGSRDNLTVEYEYANAGYGASVFVVDTGTAWQGGWVWRGGQGEEEVQPCRV